MSLEVGPLLPPSDNISQPLNQPTHDPVGIKQPRTVEGYEKYSSAPKTKGLIRHYTSLKEHAENLSQTSKEGGDDSSLSPRHQSRREGITWGERHGTEQQLRASRSPLLEELSGSESPPLLKDIVRQGKPMQDADGIQNQRASLLQRTKSDELQSSKSSPTDESGAKPSKKSDIRRSSIAAFAKGFTRHISDMRIFASEKITNSHEEPELHDSQDVNDLPKNGHVPPAPLMNDSHLSNSYENHTNIPTGFQGPTSLSPSEVMSSSVSVHKALKDRRKVDLMLSMPAAIIDLPTRNRPGLMTPTNLNFTRSKSPQAPPPVDELLEFEPRHMMKSTPILEEESIHGNIASQSGFIVPPLNNASVSSRIKRPAGPPRRNHFDSFDTIESAPYGTSVVTVPQNEQQRPRRRFWRHSEDGYCSSPRPQPLLLQTLKRRFSLNTSILRKEVTSPDERGSKSQDSNEVRSHELSRGKKAALNGTKSPDPRLSSPAPPPFIPPGVTQVPTPPIFDAEGEIKGKLAGFFFDNLSGIAGTPRRKANSTPWGYWDSDAVLMSMDMNHTDEDDEEGPEGPRTEKRKSSTFVINDPRRGGEYSNVVNSPSSHPWFRVHHDEMLDEEDRRALKLIEQEHRREFKWIMPEHLPSSPLCPLHPKYRGPYDICYWHLQKKPTSAFNITQGLRFGSENQLHGRRKEAWEVDSPAPKLSNQEWAIAKVQERRRDGKKRRLESLSSG